MHSRASSPLCAGQKVWPCSRKVKDTVQQATHKSCPFPQSPNVYVICGTHKRIAMEKYLSETTPLPPWSQQTIGSNDHTAANLYLFNGCGTKHLSSHTHALATSPSGEYRKFAKDYSSTLMQTDDRRSTSPGRKLARRLHMAPGRFIDGHFTHATANTSLPHPSLPLFLSTKLSFPPPQINDRFKNRWLGWVCDRRARITPWEGQDVADRALLTPMCCKINNPEVLGFSWACTIVPLD